MAKFSFDILDLTSFLRFIFEKIVSILKKMRNFVIHVIGNFRLFSDGHIQGIIKLSVPLIIILGGYYACASSQRAVVTNVNEIFAITDKIRTFYADKPDYWGLSVHSAISNKILASKFIKDNQRIILSSGLEILVGSGENGDIVMPMSQFFDIVMPHLNKAQCMAHTELELSQEQLIQLSSIRIVNQSGSFAFEWGGERKLPVMRYATKDLCIDGDNTVVWSFK